MKEIGEKLKEARESMGISIEEASDDLKIKKDQIEAIESGNMDAFQDVFSLKYFIRDYSKYLGLNKEDMVDDFNEYLFDYTSKISLDDIKNAKKKETPKKEVRKIQSPYTIEMKRDKRIPNYAIYIMIILLLCVVGYFIINHNNKKPQEEDTIISRKDK